jgi:16S rRNA G1207 methylase RsmC
MSHYFSEKQDSKFIPMKMQVNISGIKFDLFSSSGVFSKGELDKGTEILIRTSIVDDGTKVLDLGCGIGTVGIAIKKKYPAAEVLMADINERAVYLAEKNIILNELSGVQARKSDIYSAIDEKFDVILLNPPQTAGKDICFSMIEKAKEHLNENGTLQLVARHNKGGETLSLKMKEVFSNMTEIAKEAGFRVYLSRLNLF